MYININLYIKENQKYISLINNVIESATIADASLKNELDLRRVHSYLYAISQFKNIYDLLIVVGLVPDYKYTKVPQRKEINYDYNYTINVKPEENPIIEQYIRLLPEHEKDKARNIHKEYFIKTGYLFNTGVYSTIRYSVMYIDEFCKRHDVTWASAYITSVVTPACIKYCCSILAENPHTNLTKDI